MKTIRLEIAVPENVAFDIEAEYHRLYQQLIELKRKGVKSKAFKLHEMDVKRLILTLGIAELKKRDFQELRELC